MTYTIWTELLGYTGTSLIAISLMMNSINRLRRINLAGASMFATYGLLVGAYPVFFLNTFISLVDIYYLFQMRRRNDYFELFEIETDKSPFLNRFLEFYQKDIMAFFPNFKGAAKEDKIVFILRNMLPVGLFICRSTPGNEIEICLDYVVPSYRDMKNAHFLYHREHDLFKEIGYTCFIIKTDVPKHIGYLKKIGFVQDTARGTDWYLRKINM